MATPDPPVPLRASPPVAPSSPLLPSNRQRLLDVLLTGVVLAFAFLAASTAVRNSDFWMHLASGRLIADGSYRFGVDPFAYTTDGVYWANHAWLFDLLLYLLYNAFGGSVLVVLKALAIAVLVAVLLPVRRPGSGSAAPVACTLLAVLAMTPRLLLHSTCASYVFLGFAFWLLWRPRDGPSSFRDDLKRYAPLLLLFVLWVNVDGWFLLGPLLVLLFLLGERLPMDRREDAPRTPAWLAPVGLAVCLVNPHTWHAFVLPADLMPLPPELQHDPRFQRLFVSPWHLSFLYHPATGINLAGAAYLALVVLGPVSFLLNARRLSGRRLLVWLSFAALAAWLARAVPFFAVVAAPITALNLQEWREGRSENPSFIRGLAYFALLTSSLALIVLAWLGWLRGFAMTGRGVEWSVQPDDSLRRVAHTLQRWRIEGKLHDGDRGFAVHPSIAHYCAWFCPDEKGFLDHRFSLFRGAVAEYESVCRALHIGSEKGEGATDWRSVLRRHNVTHLIVYDPQLSRLMPALRQLAVNERDWTLLHVDGQALIVGWNDDGRSLPESVPAFDAGRLALTPNSGDALELSAVPGWGPGRGPRPADLRTQFGSPTAPPSWETEAAGVLLGYFEERAAGQARRRAARCLGWFAGLHGLSALPCGWVDGPVRLLTYLDRMPPAAGDLGQQSPALPLLAVRAARRALADNPDDANAYVCLGRAYRLLAGLTPERNVLGTLQPLDRLRHIQIAAALENALRRKPDLLSAHEALADLYEGRNYLDAALDHRREALRLMRRDGPVAGESAEAFARRLDRLATRTRELERHVGDLKNEFTLRFGTLGGEPYRKARLALGRGLARVALDDVLLQSPMVLRGGEGIALQVELQLMLGRVEEVRERLHDPDWQANKATLGFMDVTTPPGGLPAPPYRFPAYEWLLLCQTAATGDYDEAEAALQALLDRLDEPRTMRAMRQSQEILPLALVTELGLSAGQPSWLPRLLATDRLIWSKQLIANLFLLVEHADLHVVAGMLALERGDLRAAEGSFASTVTLARLGSGGPHASAGRPLAGAYQRILHDARTRRIQDK